VELGGDVATHRTPVGGIDGAGRHVPRIGKRFEDLFHEEGRATIAGSPRAPPEILGTNRLADDVGDLDAVLAELGGAAGVLGGEAHVQERHERNVKTGCLYVKRGDRRLVAIAPSRSSSTMSEGAPQSGSLPRRMAPRVLFFAAVAISLLCECSRTGLDLTVSVPTDGDGSVRRTALFFGGDLASPGADQSFSETWMFDGSSWTQLAVQGPPARMGAVMASLEGDPVLFGGDDLVTGYFGDTWIWRDGAWNQVGSSGPSPRDGAVMAPLDGRLILFGGQDGQYPPLSDTWAWDGSSWAMLDVAGPSGRIGAAMAPLNGALVLFGGQSFGPTGTPGPDSALSDTWTFDGTSWTQLQVTGPSARVGAVMAPLNGALVLFGGYELDGSSVNDDSGDTWIWDGEAWNDLDIGGPVERWSSVMVSLGDTVALYGGIGGEEGAFLSDTWTFDGTAWTQLSVTGPSARADAVMTPLP
jgi:galactose oxidase-like protein